MSVEDKMAMEKDLMQDLVQLELIRGRFKTQESQDAIDFLQHIIKQRLELNKESSNDQSS